MKTNQTDFEIKVEKTEKIRIKAKLSNGQRLELLSDCDLTDGNAVFELYAGKAGITLPRQEDLQGLKEVLERMIREKENREVIGF